MEVLAQGSHLAQFESNYSRIESYYYGTIVMVL